ncbi:IS4 family transposase [Terriglobus albidus]|uniref:IS4 family transposase n=1 Tax=Terriglobus albidus TaxID=1592106 RepID=A0A5B9EEA1_9BACT|nr:IS4 family transposase [Terriglobus albidus]QEE30014.1 IS4 family transposase [Terriglobus albidus]
MEIKAEAENLLKLFERVVPVISWGEFGGGGQIYTLPVVVEMMLLQRLSEHGTQQEAVHALLGGRLDRLLPNSKRVQGGRISANTGGYARACGRISPETVEQVCDQTLAALSDQIEAEAKWGRPVLLLDGSSVRLEHTADILKAFPAGRNQHGLGHWGIMKWVCLHDVRTGIAQRPAWGPMYGPEAVSEQNLAKKVLSRAPAGSVIIGDGGFGIFAFAQEVIGSGHQALFRLSKARALSLGGKSLPAQGEFLVCWKPSAQERKKYPELADAEIKGRLIVRSAKGFRDSLYLFTTLEQEADEIVALYGERWNLELDLRTLKGTLRLEHLHGKSQAAVEKELLIAVVAYGLVRAFMATAARRAGVDPRILSFTQAYGLINAMSPKLCSPNPVLRQQTYDRLLDYISKAKLPQRKKKRSYPREVWGRGKSFPSKHHFGPLPKTKSK